MRVFMDINGDSPLPERATTFDDYGLAITEKSGVEVIVRCKTLLDVKRFRDAVDLWADNHLAVAAERHAARVAVEADSNHRDDYEWCDDECHSCSAHLDLGPHADGCGNADRYDDERVSS